MTSQVVILKLHDLFKVATAPSNNLDSTIKQLDLITDHNWVNLHLT